MENLLNRGLNFAIMPLKLNITQVLVDFGRFERSMLWQEFWSNKEQQSFKPPIFKKKKTNMPSKHPTPAGLKIFINATKSEILDPQNRNRGRTNIPPDEIEALGELIKLQKEQAWLSWGSGQAETVSLEPCSGKAKSYIFLSWNFKFSFNKHSISLWIIPISTSWD